MAEADDASWLRKTIAAIRDTPTVTVVPRSLSESGVRALAVLEQLRGRSPIESAQLVTGAVLGEGGMGIVRTAEQVALGRTVAVKTLKQRDDAAALALLREAWLTGALEHPNIVPVHYVELADDGMPLVVMKRVAGTEWSKLIDRADEVERRFGATDLLAWNIGILMTVLNAVRFAHHKGVIHRDLKPSNVMIGDFGEVYLLDWGIAVSLRQDPSGRLPVLADEPGFAGTPAYLAPEMLGRAGDPRQSERTDVYLAGAVLHEIVTGAPPHTGSDASAVVASALASVPTLPSSLPAELQRICRCAMAVVPADRFESAEAMRLALQHYLDQRGSIELAERAAARLDELETLLARRGTRDDIYRVFGACRFGFREALARWPDNADAKAGVARAAIAVAEYELAAGEPAAAQNLLADVHAPALAARIAAAAASAVEQRDSAAKLRADLDPRTGGRARVAPAFVFGVVYAALPFRSRLLTGHAGEDGLDIVAIALGAELATVAAWFVFRRAMGATLYNRRLYQGVMIQFGVMAMIGLGAWRTGVRDAELVEMLLPVWALTVGLLAVTVELRLIGACLGYALAYGATLLWPELRDVFMSAANMVVNISLIVAWRAARLIASPRP